MAMKWLAPALAVVLLAACTTGSELEEGMADSGPAVSAGGGGGGDGARDSGVQTAETQAVDSRPVAPPPGSAEELQQVIGDRVNFAYDDHRLDTLAQDQVIAWANWLTAHSGLSVIVEGHADERGTREYNLALGERRAAEVRSYLMDSGIAADRVRIVSYGKEKPVAIESNETAWAMNRRAVMVLD